MKRSQLNAVLLVASLGLAGAVFFSQKKDDTKVGPPLTALTADAVTHIVLDHPGSPAVKLEKQAGGWKLTEPVQADADPYEVNGILSLATLETRATLNAGEVKLADLGLAPPAYKVVLNDQTLAFGAQEPLQFRRYIQLGDKVQLVDDPPATALDADYSDLVVKNLLPPKAEIEKIALPGLTIARSADGKSWTYFDQAGPERH